MRTKSEVLKARKNAVMGGCCDRFADMMGCDCYEIADPDPCRPFLTREGLICETCHLNVGLSLPYKDSGIWEVCPFMKGKKMSEEQKFTIGDQVRIKSGGIAMTVVGFVSPDAKADPNYVMVMWFENGQMRRDCLPPESLVTYRIG